MGHDHVPLSESPTIQLLTRKMHTLTYINTIYNMYFLSTDLVEKYFIKCIHFWRHDLWNYNSIWKLRVALSRNHAFRLKFSFLSKLLIYGYSATNMWLQFAPVMENTLLGGASDKVSMHSGQTIKAFLSMTICESGPWHMCLHTWVPAQWRLQLLL